jgi:hypothetical protein
MSVDREIHSELQKLESDKKMSKLAVSSAQNEMLNNLKHGLGEEINDVISGKMKIEIVKKKKSWIKKLLNTIF